MSLLITEALKIVYYLIIYLGISNIKKGEFQICVIPLYKHFLTSFNPKPCWMSLAVYVDLGAVIICNGGDGNVCVWIYMDKEARKLHLAYKLVWFTSLF